MKEGSPVWTKRTEGGVPHIYLIYRIVSWSHSVPRDLIWRLIPRCVPLVGLTWRLWLAAHAPRLLLYVCVGDTHPNTCHLHFGKFSSD